MVTSTSVYNQTQITYNISTGERGSSRFAIDDTGYVVAKTSYDALLGIKELPRITEMPNAENIKIVGGK